MSPPHSIHTVCVDFMCTLTVFDVMCTLHTYEKTVVQSTYLFSQLSPVVCIHILISLRGCCHITYILNCLQIILWPTSETTFAHLSLFIIHNTHVLITSTLSGI